MTIGNVLNATGDGAADARVGGIQARSIDDGRLIGTILNYPQAVASATGGREVSHYIDQRLGIGTGDVDVKLPPSTGGNNGV